MRPYEDTTAPAGSAGSAGPATPTAPYDLLVRSQTLVTPDGAVPGALAIRDGIIQAILPPGTPAHLTRAKQVITTAPGEVLLPGLIDAHIHVNEPGRTHWEGYATATRAAAAGGFTTILDMPLNSLPPTTTLANLEVKRAASDTKRHTDVGFWGGAIPGNTKDLADLHRAGVFGFKCFLAGSGVDEFGHLAEPDLLEAAQELARLGAQLIVHAESQAVLERHAIPTQPRYQDFLASRPTEAEEAAVAQVIRVVRETGVKAHILHLSAASALPLIAAAKAEGLPLTAETCPHYLTFSAEQIPDGAPEYKCCPPIRDEANRRQLIQGLLDGIIDYVASDHSPCEPSLKEPGRTDMAKAWGGIASVQLMAPAVWTATREHGAGLSQLATWLAAAPARLLAIGGKGRLAPGNEADFTVFAPDETFTVVPGELHHRWPITPYAGRTLQGVVKATYLRGTPIDPDHPAGRLLTRTAPSTSNS
ncbi:MAG: allantoinase AllB [Bifidobacteriaceae bacterium]|jgi:allantoinase|nr:allantoinase AllB [Bifidobacteriaceae bacterium]